MKEDMGAQKGCFLQKDKLLRKLKGCIKNNF
jgi:hypothetical protein